MVFETKEPLSYAVGDSLALFPENDPTVVDEILSKLKEEGNLSLREYLLKKADLRRLSASLLQLLKVPEAPKGAILSDVLTPVKPEDLIQHLKPLLPRFYSIASSQRVHPGEIHLTVACETYEYEGTLRYGVASHFLSRLAVPGDRVRCYVQPSRGFTLPKDPSIPIVLIGPGTGVAPFRAFLQERVALEAKGENWLFFGERNRATDFYYADFWQTLFQEGKLRLDLAFSRDQEEKIYVQHRLYEAREELWQWVKAGCHLYVCGDADRMAKEVDQMLRQIACKEENLSPGEALAYFREMRRQKRYLLDVY